MRETRRLADPRLELRCLEATVGEAAHVQMCQRIYPAWRRAALKTSIPGPEDAQLEATLENIVDLLTKGVHQTSIAVHAERA